MGQLIVVILIVGAAYGAWAYFHPWRPCPRCRGGGKNALSTRRRSGKCRRCKGSREVQAIGSRMLHRAVRSAAGRRKR
jgi:DnaJ-class molecular chaperone